MEIYNSRSFLGSEKPQQLDPQVDTILQTIDTESPTAIRMNEVDNTPYLAWGLFWADDLSFIFTAHIRDHFGVEEENWYVYAPIPVHKFKSPIPQFNGPSDQEKVDILRKMNVDTASDIDRTFNEVLSGRENEYNEFRQKYEEDSHFRASYSLAIKKACHARGVALVRQKSEHPQDDF